MLPALLTLAFPAGAARTSQQLPTNARLSPPAHVALVPPIWAQLRAEKHNGAARAPPEVTPPSHLKEQSGAGFRRTADGKRGAARRRRHPVPEPRVRGRLRVAAVRARTGPPSGGASRRRAAVGGAACGRRAAASGAHPAHGALPRRERAACAGLRSPGCCSSSCCC